MKQLKFSVAICTRNRPEKVRRLLSYIRQQTLWPNEIILVENITENNFFDKRQLKIFFKNQIEINYLSVLNRPIGFSRNLALRNSRDNYLIFIDDDIHLKNKFLFEKIKRRIIAFPKVSCWVGPVLSFTKGYWAEASEVLYSFNNWLSERNKKSFISFAPSSFLVINSKSLNIIDSKANFDKNLDTHEDLDFTLRLFKNNKILIFDPSLKVWHDFPTSFIGFMRKQIFYSKNSLKIAKRYPQDLNHFIRLFPERKLHSIFFGFKTILFIFRNALGCVKENRNRSKFFLAFLLRELFYLFFTFNKKDNFSYLVTKIKEPFI